MTCDRVKSAGTTKCFHLILIDSDLGVSEFVINCSGPTAAVAKTPNKNSCILGQPATVEASPPPTGRTRRMPVARTLGADDALERARSRLEQPRYFPENEMAEIEGKAVAWLHVCNLFSFEVSANVMTIALHHPKA
jgi:hypothetical protein